MNGAPQSSKDWRDEKKSLLKMVEAGEAALAEWEEEVSRSTLAKEVFWAMEKMRRLCDLRQKNRSLHRITVKPSTFFAYPSDGVDIVVKCGPVHSGAFGSCEPSFIPT